MPRILKVKSEQEYDKKFNHVDEPLLKPPFLGILNGSVRTGKSTILMNLIYNDSFYHDLFDKVIFISPTVMNDLTLAHLREDDEVIKVDDNLDDLDGILKVIVEEKKKDDDEIKKFYLIILDDCLGLIKPKSYASYLCTRYRQYKLSLIISSQNFRSIPNIMRTNATFYLLFKTTNRKEYNKYEEEFGGIFENFKEMYEKATAEPYNFLYLDLRHIVAYHNFEKRLV